jgi:hypothetical protein
MCVAGSVELNASWAVNLEAKGACSSAFWMATPMMDDSRRLPCTCCPASLILGVRSPGPAQKSVSFQTPLEIQPGQWYPAWLT